MKRSPQGVSKASSSLTTTVSAPSPPDRRIQGGHCRISPERGLRDLMDLLSGGHKGMVRCRLRYNDALEESLEIRESKLARPLRDSKSKGCAVPEINSTIRRFVSLLSEHGSG